MCKDDNALNPRESYDTQHTVEYSPSNFFSYSNHAWNVCLLFPQCLVLQLILRQCTLAPAMWLCLIGNPPTTPFTTWPRLRTTSERWRSAGPQTTCVISRTRAAVSCTSTTFTPSAAVTVKSASRSLSALVSRSWHPFHKGSRLTDISNTIKICVWYVKFEQNALYQKKSYSFVMLNQDNMFCYDITYLCNNNSMKA